MLGGNEMARHSLHFEFSGMLALCCARGIHLTCCCCSSAASGGSAAPGCLVISRHLAPSWSSIRSASLLSYSSGLPAGSASDAGVMRPVCRLHSLIFARSRHLICLRIMGTNHCVLLTANHPPPLMGRFLPKIACQRMRVPLRTCR